MFLKIDGMKDLSLKINGFGRTHRTHTSCASVDHRLHIKIIASKYVWCLLCCNPKN